jgi:hypothetical protein
VEHNQANQQKHCGDTEKKKKEVESISEEINGKKLYTSLNELKAGQTQRDPC